MYLKILMFFFFSISLPMVVSSQDQDSISTSMAVPEFELPDSSISNSGSIKLTWKIPDTLLSTAEHNFELQQSLKMDFDSLLVRYSGPDLATYISGLKDGNYHYRVRSSLNGDTSGWSKTIVVSVKHHSLQLAFTLFSLGAIVFIATVIVVVRGARRSSPVPSSMNTREGDA